MSLDAVIKDTEARMEKAASVFREELKGLRTGRATPGLVENLRVEQYGSPTPLKQIAQISIPEPQQILIKPFDPSTLKEIEKAIRSSDLGMSPNNDGKIIRLNVPGMSGDQRQKLVARVKKSAEDAKVSCRNIRRDANKGLEKVTKELGLSEDEGKKAQEKVQNLLKKYEAAIQETADKKSKEVMET
jgi:ribosome recycling factor